MNRTANIALVYIGDEQLSWGRQAFGYPRHYFLMPSLLYLAEALRGHRERLALKDITRHYLNQAVHQPREMCDRILSSNPAVVGLSCYSWNIGQSITLARALKQRQPDLTLVFGGPEVSYPTVEEGITFLKNTQEVDALVMGEGEETIVELLPILLSQSPKAPISGALIRAEDGQIIGAQARRNPLDLSTQPVIPLAEEAAQIEHSPGAAVGIVYQTYRGCPYNCVYCGFDGGGHRVRLFPLDKIKAELTALLIARVSLIHFADAVFDLRPERTREILEHCRDHAKDTSLYGYAAMQRTDEKLAQLFRDTKTQIGIGLQTTDEAVLNRVRRKFSVEKLFAVLRSDVGRAINYYLDIMFGLPGDSPEGFRQTINEVMALDPPFIMPFPLTVVPRSELAGDLAGFEINRYDMAEINETVEPLSGVTYAHIGLFRGFDLTDLRAFDHVCTAIFYSFQRYPVSIRMLARYAARAEGHELDAFGILERVGLKIRQQVGDQTVDVVNPPFVDGGMREALSTALSDMGAQEVESSALSELLKIESTVAGIFYRSDRKEAYYLNEERKKREIDAEFPSDLDAVQVSLVSPLRLVKVSFDYADMCQLPELRHTIEPRSGTLAVMAPWDDWIPKIEHLDPMESAICETLPRAKEVSLAKLDRRMSRLEKKLKISMEGAIVSLANKGIIIICRPD